MMKVTIYTKENCSFCTNAKLLLNTRGIAFNELKLNEDFTREHLLELYPTAQTFPVIVIDGFNIGGYTQLKAKLLNEETTSTKKFLTEG